MRFRFLHMADVHLGNRQYGVEERAKDFAAVFYDAIDYAVNHKLDFVLIAGDLFHKRQIDAMTLNQAVFGLQKLRAAGIPCIVVQGNHELAPYGEVIGWVSYLALQDLVVLLHPALDDDPLELKPFAARSGGYLDVRPGVRIYGLHFTGAACARTIARYAQAIGALPPERAAQADGTPVDYAIFMAHTGVQGVLAGDSSSPTMSDWRALDAMADYIALGHIHKPFDFEDRFFNPGSLESCGVDEVDWHERGFLVVDVDTRSAPKQRVDRVRSQRRPFLRLSLKVDRYASADALLAACRELIEEEAARPAGKLRPLVELSLTGTLRFAHQALDVADIEQLVHARLNPLYVMVRNKANPLESAGVELDEELSRDEMERTIFNDLFRADAAFTEQSELWAASAMAVKSLALRKAPPGEIVAEIDATLLKAAQPTPAHAPAPDLAAPELAAQISNATAAPAQELAPEVAPQSNADLAQSLFDW